MYDKNIQKSVIMYKPKKNRKVYHRPDIINVQKSQNLKQLHRTLCDHSIDNLRHPQRSSAAQLHIKTRQQNSSTKNMLSKEKQLRERIHNQSSVNFYINIEKLRNLKIANKDKSTFNPPSSHLKKTGLSYQRKSALLRNYGADQKKNGLNSSYQSQQQKSLNRISQYRKRNAQQKTKIRYKTHGDESSIIYKSTNSNYSKQSLPKRPNFKKANDSVIKDKTFIQGYLRGKQLGRGGFSKVWQGFHFKNKKFYAIKQIDTKNKYQTHLTQIWFGNFFFENGNPKKEFLSHRGIYNLLTMYAYQIVDPRAFIVYESCEGSLGNMLYDIYEEDRDDDIEQDDKLYMIKYKQLYLQMKKSPTFLKSLIYEVALALDLLHQNKIVHSDLKTQNILIKDVDQNGNFHFKLIDYGSSFVFESLKQYKLATPEYMCPQLLNYILYENRKPCHQSMLEFVRNYQNTSAIDVWGLGSIVLQLIHGLPLWLSNNTKILVDGKYQTKKGLFAVSDRSFAKILERQLSTVQKFDNFLLKENNSGICIDKILKELLLKMLHPNPIKRIKPRQIVQLLREEID